MFHRNMATDDNLDVVADVVAVPSPSGNAKVGLSEKAQALKDQWQSANPKGTIGQKKIVQTLCKYVEEVKRDNLRGVLTSYLVYMCPKDGLCRKNGGRMEVEKNTGYNNPYQHLLSCYFRSDKKAMHDSYWEALASKKAQASLCNFFSKATSDKDGGDDGGEQNKGDKGGGLPPRLLTEKDKELFEWIESIVEDNLPVLAVHSKKWRRRLKHEHCFHKKTVTGVMITLTFLVSILIKEEMATAPCGSIMHDAWTKFSGHYFALLAMYFAERHEICEDGVCRPVNRLRISMLSLAPLHQLDRLIDMEGDNEDDDTDDNEDKEEVNQERREASNFTAEVHANHIKVGYTSHVLLFDVFASVIIDVVVLKSNSHRISWRFSTT